MTQLTENVFAVEVPDNAYGFEQDNPLQYGELVYYLDYPSVYNFRFVALPPGNWQFICTTREATNGNAMGIVKSHYSRSASYNPVLGHYQTSGSSTTFMDYMNGHCTFDSPLDSLRSLITSKGLDVNKNYCLLKKEK